jgi:transposase
VLDVDDWGSIRWLHLREGKSLRWIAEEFGMSRKTVAKYVQQPEAPTYLLSKPRAKPLTEQWQSRVEEILDTDKSAPRKQRHTARRIYDRLVEEGYTGSARTIRQMVAEITNKPAANASIPLIFEPGKDAQVDFGESYVDLGEQRVKLYGFEMRLNYSRKKFVMYFQTPDKEAFLEGHIRAFQYFGGVVERLTYDNLGAAIVRTGRGKERKLTKEFNELKGYYAFQTHFCTPGEEGAHEKGGVESGIGFSRRNWMVPVPKFASTDDLNAYVLKKCQEDEDRTVDGQKQTIGEAWQKEKEQLLSLPAKPFDPAVRHGGRVDGYCTLSFKNNHYSVPAKFAGRSLWIKSYWDRVEIGDGVEIVAQHLRSYGKDEYVLCPAHYLDLLEKKPNAVAYARPLVTHNWPEGYWKFYQNLVSKLGTGEAGRNFIRLLRCHVKYGGAIVSAALSEARQLGVVNADVVISIIDRERFKRSVPEVMEFFDDQSLHNFVVRMVPEPAQYQILTERGLNNDQQRVA